MCALSLFVYLATLPSQPWRGTTKKYPQKTSRDKKKKSKRKISICHWVPRRGCCKVIVTSQALCSSPFQEKEWEREREKCSSTSEGCEWSSPHFPKHVQKHLALVPSHLNFFPTDDTAVSGSFSVHRKFLLKFGERKEKIQVYVCLSSSPRII